MVLPSLIPTCDAESDVLTLLTIESQQVRDVLPDGKSISATVVTGWSK